MKTQTNLINFLNQFKILYAILLVLFAWWLFGVGMEQFYASEILYQKLCMFKFVTQGK